MEVSSSQVPGRASALDYRMIGEASGRELLLGAGDSLYFMILIDI